MKTFEPNKTAKELGIDLSRKFIVVEDNAYLKKGEILKIDEDDGGVISSEIQLANNFKRLKC